MDKIIDDIKNNTIVELNIEPNNINIDQYTKLFELLKYNISVKIVTFSYDLTVKLEYCKLLSDLLKVNETIRILRIIPEPKPNMVCQEGFAYIIDALKINKTLTSITFSINMLTNDNCKSLANLLNYNNTLLEIGLKVNYIFKGGYNTILSALEYNSSIECLYGIMYVVDYSDYNNNDHSIDIDYSLENMKNEYCVRNRCNKWLRDMRLQDIEHWDNKKLST
jgi:hypothetical protein